ncbi:MAG: FLgD tudor-like domain-containing protein, partial [Lachnospiraceae bacterium]
NQDMTKPMDNSEMMAQMTQMAMVQSLGAMSDSTQTATAVSTQTYAAGLVGQEITVAVTEEGHYGQPITVGVAYGKVESVNLTGGIPMIKLEGDGKEYPLSYVLGMGRIEDPYAGKEEEDDEETETETDAASKK